ncbi:alpha/beta fold hydrolase [Solimonas sp. K1W22B-7]|uniref:alpha/beta fold hydrolase n=1 Tax=Solimonas sp. K1W22B-7 TaxID=2303331 RepID=UPI000E3326AE|nr:alpha/beta fold hydrolase [Solimonas sp. K1W22B-7]AXQ30517.1 alpha/beta fold hydrolase [Solimonas sp. K1W22B-7]
MSTTVFDRRDVDISGWRLHARIRGRAGPLPTVVLESGGGGVQLPSWRSIEEALEPHTRVLSYERAGIGDSTGPLDSVRPEAVAQRLERLLQALDVTEPVILAGHSIGGLYSRYFATTRPHRVAGLVLLDATPEDLPFPRSMILASGIAFWAAHCLARMGVLKRLGLPPHQIAAMGSRRHVKSVLAEIGALRDIQADIAGLTPSIPLPTLAISAGLKSGGSSRRFEQFRHSHHRLAAMGRAPHSRHLRIEGAQHMSMLTEPSHAHTVAAGILDFARKISRHDTLG